MKPNRVKDGMASRRVENLESRITTPVNNQGPEEPT